MMSQADIDFLNNLSSNTTLLVVLILLGVWSLVWKGFALWKASRNDQRNWFIALLVLNTCGILEIVYIFHFSKEKPQKVV